jgi:hypothetical protein
VACGVDERVVAPKCAAVVCERQRGTGRSDLPNEAAIDTERLELEHRRNVLDARRASLDAAREEQQEAVETMVGDGQIVAELMPLEVCFCILTEA